MKEPKDLSNDELCERTLELDAKATPGPWVPRPRIWIDDGWGRIKILPGGVTASALYGAWKAEGGNEAALAIVAGWYDVTVDEVKLAIKCEEYIRPKVKPNPDWKPKPGCELARPIPPKEEALEDGEERG